ncbi:MAG: glycosyltransferase family 4 protein [Planctomycetia bacterium]|nr:glycosyltransferase family 4 protein [Planctomycetia bacterium]
MRVALFSRNLHTADAVGKQVLAKLHFFQQRGAEVKLFLTEPCSQNPELNTTQYVIGSAKEIWKQPEHRRYLQSSDWIIAEFAASYSLLDLLPALQHAGPRVLIDYHGITPLELAEEGLKSEIIQANSQCALLWCADAVMVHSQFAAGELQSAINLPAERIYVIPCWVQASVQQNHLQNKVQQLRLPFGRSRILLFTGRMARNKLPEMLIQALSILNQTGQSYQAVFIGKQDDIYQTRLQACHSLARQLGVEDRVHFMGCVSNTELQAWYSAADTLILPSRHECFGMPIVEAMMSGTPVIGLQAGSLPEVIGHAGYTVRNPEELASQLQVLFSKPVVCSSKRVAIVTHRYGQHFAGGAEKSLRTMAKALQQRGYAIDILTTCNVHENRWSNTLPAGTVSEDGFQVKRFPIDPFNASKLGDAYEKISQRRGKVDHGTEQLYLNNSLSSQSLIAELKSQLDQYQAVITGPYLFKLVYDVVQACGSKVLLAPCFHNEPLARLEAFRTAYRQAGGMLFHSDVEAEFTSQLLGIHHPRHAVMGTVLEPAAFQGNAASGQQKCGENYLVYVGRYCPEKGLDCLIEWLDQINRNSANPVKLVCMGQGPRKLPSKPWLMDLGYLDEAEKRDVIAGALALVNLSRQESLSIVALEAWALGVPVIVHEQCSVLKEQVKRSQAGRVVGSVQALKDVITTWMKNPDERVDTGSHGRTWVMQEYASAERYAGKLDQLVRSLSDPISKVAKEQGIRRANGFDPALWEERLSLILDAVWSEEPRKQHARVEIELLQHELVLTPTAKSIATTVRARNLGNILLPSHGPARCSWQVQWLNAKHACVGQIQVIPLAAALMPGQEQMCVLSIDVPADSQITGMQLQLRQKEMVLNTATARIMEKNNSQSDIQHDRPIAAIEPLLRQLRSLLSEAKQVETLPETYQDVTEGLLATLKKQVKHKLLNNFRKAYVDVAFRQQSDLNEKLIVCMSLLLEALSTQDSTAQAAEQDRRVRRLEKQMRKDRRQIRLLERQLQRWQTPVQTGIQGETP